MKKSAQFKAGIKGAKKTIKQFPSLLKWLSDEPKKRYNKHNGTIHQDKSN